MDVDGFLFWGAPLSDEADKNVESRLITKLHRIHDDEGPVVLIDYGWEGDAMAVAVLASVTRVSDGHRLIDPDERCKMEYQSGWQNLIERALRLSQVDASMLEKFGWYLAVRIW